MEGREVQEHTIRFSDEDLTNQKPRAVTPKASSSSSSSSYSSRSSRGSKIRERKVEERNEPIYMEAVDETRV
jgi:hypothetical protein